MLMYCAKMFKPVFWVLPFGGVCRRLRISCFYSRYCIGRSWRLLMFFSRRLCLRWCCLLRVCFLFHLSLLWRRLRGFGNLLLLRFVVGICFRILLCRGIAHFLISFYLSHHKLSWLSANLWFQFQFRTRNEKKRNGYTQLFRHSTDQ